jgi:hypothetical protein
LARVPGSDAGTQDQEASTPALPKEQDSPGGTGSTRVTPCPFLRSSNAQQVPTMPAPTTTTRDPPAAGSEARVDMVSPPLADP